VLEQPTGQVLVSVNAAGHASYDFAADTAWDNLAWSEDLARLAASADVVCFGTLAQRSGGSRETIRRFVSTTPGAALRVFDINLRPPFFSDSIILESLALANVLKLNEDELQVLAPLCDLRGTPTNMLQQLTRRYDLELAALTRGAAGALLVRGEQVSEHPGVPTRVVDTVGAGDAFTAAMVVGLLARRDLAAINEHACRLAAFVCSCPGATPEIPRGPDTDARL
jgi:fructokinase